MLQEASFTGLLKIILYIVLFYYLFKVLSRIFAPIILRFVAKKAEQRFGGQFQNFGGQRQKQNTSNEGEVTIDKTPKNKTSNKNVGEYVDYEEID